MAKGDELTTKQLLFLREYVKTGNATKAALAVYDCKDEMSAASMGYETLRKLHVTELMEEVGLSRKALVQMLAQNIAKPVKKILKKTTVRTEVPLTPEGEEMKFTRDKKGRIMVLGTQEVTEFEYEDTIDHSVRQRALDTAFRLYEETEGAKDKGNSINIGTVQVVNYANSVPQEEEVQEPQSVVGQVVDESPQNATHHHTEDVTITSYAKAGE